MRSRTDGRLGIAIETPYPTRFSSAAGRPRAGCVDAWRRPPGSPLSLAVAALAAEGPVRIEARSCVGQELSRLFRALEGHRSGKPRRARAPRTISIIYDMNRFGTLTSASRLGRIARPAVRHPIGSACRRACARRAELRGPTSHDAAAALGTTAAPRLRTRPRFVSGLLRGHYTGAPLTDLLSPTDDTRPHDLRRRRGPPLRTPTGRRHRRFGGHNDPRLRADTSFGASRPPLVAAASWRRRTAARRVGFRDADRVDRMLRRPAAVRRDALRPPTAAGELGGRRGRAARDGRSDPGWGAPPFDTAESLMDPLCSSPCRGSGAWSSQRISPPARWRRRTQRPFARTPSAPRRPNHAGGASSAG